MSWSKDEKNWKCFSILVAVSFVLLVSLNSESTNFFQKVYAGESQFSIPTLRNCQKAQLVLIFVVVATHFSPKLQSSIIQKLSQSSRLLVRERFFENFGFVPREYIVKDR